jgi:hypothetical protein
VPEPTPLPSGPASLAIEQVSIVSKFPPSDGFNYYWVRFLLRETGGQGGAMIERVQITAPDSNDDTGPWCWGDSPLWVPPGGTLNVFHDDTGIRVLGDYCAPAIRARSQSFQLDVRVTFRDRTGGEGVTETTARVEQ